MRDYRIEADKYGCRCVYLGKDAEPVAYEEKREGEAVGEWIPTAYGVSLAGPRVEIWGPATEERVRELLESGDAEMGDPEFVGGMFGDFEWWGEEEEGSNEEVRRGGGEPDQHKGKVQSKVTGYWH